MSKQGRAPKPNLKAGRDLKPKVESRISVSLQYLSNNKQRNFDFFPSKNFRVKTQVFEQFVEFLRRLTSKTQLDIGLLAKDDDCGYEQIPFQQINCQPAGVTLGKDTNICVFRFGDNGNYRMLGFFESKQPVLNIIGFDFDFSAYEH